MSENRQPDDEIIEIIADDLNTLNLLEKVSKSNSNTQKFKSEKTHSLKENRFSPILRKMSDPPSGGASAGPSGNAQSSPIFDKKEISALMNAIPEYFPGQNLSIFISEIDNLMRHLHGKLTHDQVYLVSFSIRSKIKGDARDFIAHQNATDWSEIRRALLQKYGDQRSEELLESAVRQCVQKRNETYLDYYGRLLKAHSELMQYVCLHNNDKNYLAYKTVDYAKLALKTFQIGVLDPYRTYISNFELKTIEECLNKCKFYDNRKREWDYCEFLRKNNNETFNKRPQKFLPPVQNPTHSFGNYSNQSINYQNQFTNYPTQSNNYSTQSFQTKQYPQPSHTSNPNSFVSTPNNQVQQNRPNMQFSGPINKPLSQPNRFPTNKQVFGTKPGSNFSRVQNRNFTPMSVQSRVRTQQTPIPSTSTQRPPVIVEELYNVESDGTYFEHQPTDTVQYEDNEQCYEYESDENFQIAASEQQE